MTELSRRIERRMAELSTRADSIQTLTQYALHHKAHYNVIVDIWQSVLRSHSNDAEKRIALFYACNDIVQNCKRKSADVYLKAFELTLQQVVGLFKEPTSLCKKVERVLKIWQERRVYSSSTVQSLLSKLNQGLVTPVATPTLIAAKTAPSEQVTKSEMVLSGDSVAMTTPAFSVSDIVAKFKAETLVEKLRQQAAIDSDVMGRGDLLNNLDVDASDLDVIKNLKNKAEGKEFCDKFERSYTAMQSFVALLERQVEARRQLVETLENAEVFYDGQYSEVVKISHVYNKYLSNVNQVIKKATDRMEELPEAPNEASTPSTVEDESVEMDIESADSKKVDFAVSSQLPLPPMPPMLMGMIPPPTAFDFAMRPHGMPVPPPPPPPPSNMASPQRHFGSPRFTSPPPPPHAPSMPPRFNQPRFSMEVPPPPPPQANFHHPHPHQDFSVPPPPVSPSRATIPTLIGSHQQRSSPQSANAPGLGPFGSPPPPPPSSSAPPHHNGVANKRKRFEGDFNSGSDNHLVPAQPVMPTQGRPISTISTIVGVRRGGGGAGGGSDPRANHGAGTYRGAGAGMRNASMSGGFRHNGNYQ